MCRLSLVPNPDPAFGPSGVSYLFKFEAHLTYVNI
jgi:hypothetical protein